MASSSTAERRTQAERRSDSERALLNAAARLFARRGVDATSLADIGSEAGVSRGLASHHFKSRAVLVQRLAERSQQSFVRSAPLTRVDVDGLVALADTYLDQVTADGDDARAFFVMWGASFAEEAPLREAFLADDARFRDGIERFVRAAQERGAARADADPVGFAIAYVALLRGIGAQYAVAGQALNLGAARRSVGAFVRAALEVRP